MSIYIQLLIASLFWGSNVVVMKLLLNHIPFLFLATLRVFLSLVFLAIYFQYKNISFLYSYKRKAMFLGMIGIYINFFLTFLGMNQVKGIDNALMNALAPVMTFFFSMILLKQKGNWKVYLAIGMSVFAFLLSIQFHIFDVQIGFFIYF